MKSEIKLVKANKRAFEVWRWCDRWEIEFELTH